MLLPFLSSHGILGLNARNLLYVKPFNRKKAVAFADDKLKSKAFLSARGIPSARLYARIDTREQIYSLDFSKLPDECVLKPNYGFGGEGIVVLTGRTKVGSFKKLNGDIVTQSQLKEHMEDILDGKYSVNGRRDSAFFEQILKPHECFAPFRPVGLPDVRVIVFNLVPVMAMLRIPTADSDGKANVHLGGIGIGLDIAKGITTYGAQYHGLIKEFAHGGSVAGHEIPYWDEILTIASRIQQITNLGYLAADITIDATMGPALLEVNARAGLMVQVANLAPLRARLERVKGIRVSSPEKGVRIGQDLFGEKVKQKDTDTSTGKPVLGTMEIIEISGVGATIEAPAVIATDEERTIFAPGLIANLIEKNGAELENEEEHTYRVKFTLKGKKLQTLVQLGEVKPPARAIIGRRDLTGFLIDPTKTEEPMIKKASVKQNLQAVDKLLAGIDRELTLLKALKPVNLAEERRRLRGDKKYNPVFSFPELSFDADDILKRLDKDLKDDSPLGILLEKKRRELITRVDLLQSLGNTQKFTAASRALYGAPSSDLIKSASMSLKQRIACDLPPPPELMLNAEKAKLKFEEALKRYGLYEWEVVVRQRLIADCTVGGKKIFLRTGATFSPVRVEALIAHEIETHVLTSENGNHQPFAIFRRGLSNYLDTQEGLATYNQNRILSPHDEKRYDTPRGVLAVTFALDHSFAETRQYLEEELGHDPERALTKALQTKRGLSQTEDPGGFTKGIVYYRGLRAIEQFMKDDGDMRRLYVGKIALEDLELVEQIEGIKKPLILPEWLREEVKEKPAS